jgi:hypothetical protein
MTLGHVAFVPGADRPRDPGDPRQLVDHRGRPRSDRKDVTVVDVSPAGDWSQVKVWYDPIRDLGTTVYPTNGFIYQNAQASKIAAATSKIALAQNAAVSLAKSAANQVAASVRASPLDIITQASDSTDRIAALIAAATSSEDNKQDPQAQAPRVDGVPRWVIPGA